MNKRDFRKLDFAILERIRRSACTFTSINASVEEIAKASLRSYNGQAFRLVDRRVQALRKQGFIYFDKGQWFIKPQRAGDE